MGILQKPNGYHWKKSINKIKLMEIHQFLCCATPLAEHFQNIKPSRPKVEGLLFWECTPTLRNYPTLT
jgi:hypothetical protein